MTYSEYRPIYLVFLIPAARQRHCTVRHGPLVYTARIGSIGARACVKTGFVPRTSNRIVEVKPGQTIAN